jgi:hypothetical protein
MLKVGVLIPQSKAFPKLGKEFIDGLKLLFSEKNTFIVEGIGYGDHTQEICNKIDKLVLQDDVNAIVGYVGDYGLHSLLEKVNLLEIPAIFARLGAYPNINFKNNKYAFTLSYGLCDSLNLLSQWLIDSGYKKIGVSNSFNDAGYGFVKSLEKSIYKLGGEFTGHYTPPLNPRTNESYYLEQFYKNLDNDIVCQFYNGIFAEENLTYLEIHKNEINIPLVFLPFGLNQEQLEQAYNISNDIYMVAPWLPVEMTKVQNSLDHTFFKAYSYYPTILAMLGYETAQALNSIIPERGKLLSSIDLRMNESFMNGSWNKELVYSLESKIWKLNKANSVYHFEEIKASVINNDTSFEGQQNGWYNAYLCY